MTARANKNQKATKTTPGAIKQGSRRRLDQGANTLPTQYRKACELARNGQYRKASAIYHNLRRSRFAKKDARLRALIQNDLAAIDVLQGRLAEACQALREVREPSVAADIASLNLALVESELARLASASPALPSLPEPSPGGQLGQIEPTSLHVFNGSANQSETPEPHDRVRVAVVSLLFNWPSTGGGNMHTAGLVDFLGRAGYDARHFYAGYAPWAIGRVANDELPASTAIEFRESDWNVPEIQRRFRAAVDAFGPDYVVISDTWNMKPHVAEAMHGYPTILLMQAQECLCPLNNLRLIGIGPAQVEQCPRNQLATPQVCHQCLAERGHHSGALHQVERSLAGVGTPKYDHLLRQTLHDAEAVLVLNPITAAMLEPYAQHVRIVPWGIDPARFPWPPPDHDSEASPTRSPDAKVTLFMAAVAGETIKGFHVAHEACKIVRKTRSDFELVVTFDPPDQLDEITRSVGWCSQAELPKHYQAADIVLVPTIAQDALSITSVEAMATAKPVIASRIGGLPYTVTDGLTGLLFDPGNPFDLAEKIRQLLDEPELRRWMGQAGRSRFEQDFMWPDVIDRYWRPLLGKPVTG
jgi:glycosyltransferase involved in cell wall biosynthesis